MSEPSNNLEFNPLVSFFYWLEMRAEIETTEGVETVKEYRVLEIEEALSKLWKVTPKNVTTPLYDYTGLTLPACEIEPTEELKLFFIEDFFPLSKGYNNRTCKLRPITTRAQLVTAFKLLAECDNVEYIDWMEANV